MGVSAAAAAETLVSSHQDIIDPRPSQLGDEHVQAEVFAKDCQTMVAEALREFCEGPKQAQAKKSVLLIPVLQQVGSAGSAIKFESANFHQDIIDHVSGAEGAADDPDEDKA